MATKLKCASVGPLKRKPKIMLTRDQIQELKSSPIFNLSLSSRELFHSNFIFWVASIEPKSFREEFSKALSVEISGDFMPSHSFREKQNLDIVFSYQDHTVVIENKFKSIATIEQLERYSTLERADGAICVLLSLSKPEFFPSVGPWVDPESRVCWHFLSYEDLAKIVSMVAKKTDDRYHAMLMVDYAKVVALIAEIADATCVEPSDDFSFTVNAGDSDLAIAEELRLSDFYLKRKYELITTLIRAAVTDSDFSDDVAVISHGFTRGQGLTDIKILIADGLYLGVQIQGLQYRKVIEVLDGDHIPAHNLTDICYKTTWIKSFDEAHSETFPKASSGRAFNKFGDTFKYRYFKMDPRLKISELVDLVIAHISEAIEIKRTWRLR